MPLDIEAIRAQFPILSRTVHDQPLVYLDNAASAQKPLTVMQAMTDQMSTAYANVHRGLHQLASETTQAYEAARTKVADFLGAPGPETIVFTKSASEALNLVAYGLSHEIRPGDEILISQMEHHSNIIPWHFLRERHGAVLRFAPVTESGELDIKGFTDRISSKTRIIALTHMSNVLGSINPIKEIAAIARQAKAVFVVDGAQSAVHMPIDVQALEVDFFCMTGHKLYGPTGIGALYGRVDMLARLQPFNGGGEMIENVYEDHVSYADPPYKFEAGTPPIVQAIGLGAAIDWLLQYDRAEIQAHEEALYQQALKGLETIDGLRVYGKARQKGAILTFDLLGTHPHDVAQILDRYGIAIRAGQHCAQPLMTRFDVFATARASFAIYNSMDDVECFIDGVKKTRHFLS